MGCLVRYQGLLMVVVVVEVLLNTSTLQPFLAHNHIQWVLVAPAPHHPLPVMLVPQA